MSTPAVVFLRNVTPHGDGELWTLELEPDQALLRDGAGELRNVFSPEDAHSDWAMPSFSSGTWLTLPTDNGFAAFRCGRRGLAHIRAFIRRGVVASGPSGVGRAWRGAIAEFAIGLLLTAAGVGGTLVSMNQGAGGLTVFYGVVLFGLIELGRGAYRLRECILLRNQQPDAPDDGLAPEVVDPPAPPARPARAFLMWTLGILAIAIAIAVALEQVTSRGRSHARGSPTPHPTPRPVVAPISPANVIPPTPPTPPDAVAATQDPQAGATGHVIVSGAVVFVEAPESVRGGALVSDTGAHLFIECDVRTLAAPLRCDTTIPGIIAVGRPGNPGTIFAGAHVRSYLLHADVSQGRSAVLQGTIVFEDEIIGVITERALLDDSDQSLGREGVLYPTGGRWRGWFDGDKDDWITVAADRRTLSFRCHTGQWVDQARIITTAWR